MHFAKPETPSTSTVNHEQDEQDDVETSPLVDRKTRSTSTPRASCNPDPNIYQSMCVICGYKRQKGKYEKFRICEEDRAERFLNAALFFKDKVYTRICDLEDVQRIFGADLQCHKDCIKLYLLQHERAIQDGQNSERLSSRSERERVFKSIMVRIEQQLKNGIGYPLSDLRDACNSSMLDLDKFGSFDNKEQKVLLHNYLGEKIFFYSYKSGEIMFIIS